MSEEGEGRARDCITSWKGALVGCMALNISIPLPPRTNLRLSVYDWLVFGSHEVDSLMIRLSAANLGFRRSAAHSSTSLDPGWRPAFLQRRPSLTPRLDVR